MPPKRNWIQSAIRHPGALTATAHRHGFSSALPFARAVVTHRVRVAPITRKRANLALTLNSLRPKRGYQRRVKGGYGPTPGDNIQRKTWPESMTLPEPRAHILSGNAYSETANRINTLKANGYSPMPLGGYRRRRGGFGWSDVGNFFANKVTPALRTTFTALSNLPIVGTAAKIALIPLDIQKAVLGVGKRVKGLRGRRIGMGHEFERVIVKPDSRQLLKLRALANGT